MLCDATSLVVNVCDMATTTVPPYLVTKVGRVESLSEAREVNADEYVPVAERVCRTMRWTRANSIIKTCWKQPFHMLLTYKRVRPAKSASRVPSDVGAGNMRLNYLQLGIVPGFETEMGASKGYFKWVSSSKLANIAQSLGYACPDVAMTSAPREREYMTGTADHSRRYIYDGLSG